MSNHLSLLAPVAHALGALLFPFEWQGAFIPVMPATMLEVSRFQVHVAVECNRACMEEGIEMHRT